MVSFLVSLAVLIVGYFTYGYFIDKVFGPDVNRKTPAISSPDGVDNVPMSGWKLFMIQFLNIAGLGPIFGAIMGAKFGVSSYLWIVLGTIFGGAVHDYLAGMISIRNGGISLPEIVGRTLGRPMRQFASIFTILLMILVGVVFVSGPAGLLDKLIPSVGVNFWILIIFLYYILATLLPIDKIIGRIYPLFAFALLFMALGVGIMLVVNNPDLPEFTQGFQNTHPEGYPIFPMMFISIACGAISGFHATQSPMVARCMKSEKQGRAIFYGAMVTEGVVALIWAAAATYYFQKNGFDVNNAAIIVNDITSSWLGTLGSFIAILGVVFAPITSGDTALRTARLIVSDVLGISQKTIRKRLVICIPIFVITIMLLLFSIRNKEGFDIIWRYFAWSNQTLSVITLWAITVYLKREHKPYWLTMLPAIFMTIVTVSYIVYAPEGMGLSIEFSFICGVVAAILFTGLMVYEEKFHKQNNRMNDREIVE